MALKDIRIFVASSKELVAERNALAFLVLAKEDEFERRGLRVRLSKWEYVDPKMTAGRTEDRYLDEMYNCDAAMVIFKDIAGMYTREELDKALAREAAGLDRIKTHRILFCSEGASDSDAARLRASLQPGGYRMYSGLDGLEAEFLSLVDEVAESGRLEDAQDEDLREVSAFVAADDELAEDRDAFADMVLNLNDILARRGVRVRMRFYAPERHRELLESSEMALVLYDTNYRAFGPDRMRDAYERTKREENPKRLYVFFRDEVESKLDPAFLEFRDGFVGNLGHFFCRFENADTLKLNFLLSLENALGDGAAFVKLDGRKIKADELEVAEITKLPMVANNGGLNDLLSEADQIATKFERQRQTCRENPEDAQAYKELLSLSTKKNELESRVNKELSRSFDLARRMAAVSAKEANDTLSRARALLDQGRIEEAVQLLDGASSEIDDVLGDIGGIDDLMEQKLKTLEAWVDVELFRADTVLVFAQEPFLSRFAKAEGVFRNLLLKCQNVLLKGRPRVLAGILRRFAKLYGEVGDSLRPIPLLEQALKAYLAAEIYEPDCCGVERAEVHLALAHEERLNNRLGSARENYARAQAFFRGRGREFLSKLAECLFGLARLNTEANMLKEAEGQYQEVLRILRELMRNSPKRYRAAVASSLNDMGRLHASINRLEEAEREYVEALGIYRCLAKADPEKYNPSVATSLQGLANLHLSVNLRKEAGREYAEVLAIRRLLVQDNPARFGHALAGALWNMANFHRVANDYEEAAAKWAEAIPIFRSLADGNPEQYDGTLARALRNAGTVQCDLNRLDEAERMYAESLGILRRLAKDNSAKFDPMLASPLLDLANLHKRVDRFEEAGREYAEGLQILRRLARDNPAKFEGELARALSCAGDFQRDLDRLDEAERMYTEALGIRRRLAQANPAKYDAAVATSLQDLANLHKSVNRLEEADREYAEALGIRRCLSRVDPAKYDAAVATSLQCLANLHKSVNRLEEADREYAEALGVLRRLARANPAKFDGDLASVLSCAGDCLCDLDCRYEAERMYAEALGLHRRLAQVNPAKYDAAVATSLQDLANLHESVNRLEAAERECTEALRIRRRLSQDNSSKYDPEVASSLLDLAFIHERANQLEEAGREYAESLEIFRRLAKDCPEKFDWVVAYILDTIGWLMLESCRMQEAETAFAEALQLRQALAAANPDKFNGCLADTLYAQAKVQIGKGDRAAARSNLERACEILRTLAAGNAEKFADNLSAATELLATVAND